MGRIAIYDTTLRDGSQGEGVNFSLQDKLLITRKLDDLGVDLRRGRLPPVQPQGRRVLPRRPRSRPLARQDHGLRHDPPPRHRRRGRHRDARPGRRRDAPRHRRRQELGPPRPRGPGRLARRERPHDRRLRRLPRKAQGPEVVYDAEHFFDGFKHNRDYALSDAQARRPIQAGATLARPVRHQRRRAARGGRLGRRRGPPRDVRADRHPHPQRRRPRRGQHPGGRTRRGATQVQGTINGIGERCGNVDLGSAIANLALKYRGHEVLRPGSLAPADGGLALRLRDGQHELPRRPAVRRLQRLRPQGRDARPRRPQDRLQLRAHRPLRRRQRAPHPRQRAVRQARTSPRSSPSTVSKATRPCCEASSRRVQDLENEGYQFEAAEASFVLLVEKLAGRYVAPIRPSRAYRVSVENGPDGSPLTEATVKLRVGDSRTSTPWPRATAR